MNEKSILIKIIIKTRQSEKKNRLFRIQVIINEIFLAKVYIIRNKKRKTIICVQYQLQFQDILLASFKYYSRFLQYIYIYIYAAY